MGSEHKNVTPAVQAANRSNSADSTGPTTDSGKEKSKMNAFKSGKYARRPDPVELLLNGHSDEEEAERDELRADVIRRYQPPDAFAQQQAEELADLQLKLRRLERAKEAIGRRERELLKLEQRRRAFRLKQGGLAAGAREVHEVGLSNLPDSPGKFREMLKTLRSFLDQDWNGGDIEPFLNRLYGKDAVAWRGMRVRWAVADYLKAENQEDVERARQNFVLEVEREIEQVREELAICELEQGPLSPAGQATRLLEVMGSRKWSWIRHQENFLLQSIDRKVRVLIELRREHDPGRGQTRVDPLSGHEPGSGGPAGGGNGRGSATILEPIGTAEASEADGPDDTPEEDRTSPELEGCEPVGLSVADAPGVAPVVGSQDGERRIGEHGLNQGTKPLSHFLSTEAWERVEPWFLEELGLSPALAGIMQSEWTFETVLPWGKPLVN